MKLTSVKAMVAKVMTVGLLAGAVVMAAPAKAQAQGFGVQVGFRHYDYSRRDRFEFERRQEWLRVHRYHDGFYGGYYR
jgi:hypothetical protein